MYRGSETRNRETVGGGEAPVTAQPREDGGRSRAATEVVRKGGMPLTKTDVVG